MAEMSHRCHIYVSTACQHEHEDPELHKLCRRTCKWCGSGCVCPRHARENLDENV